MAISKNQISAIKKLQQKKYRQSLGKFVVEGEKMLAEALEQKAFDIDQVFAYPEIAEKIRKERPEIEVFDVDNKELGRISSLKNPNKALVVLKTKPVVEDSETVKNDISLYLEDIRDPGNMGTIIRTADWFGIKHVFISAECVEVYNPKVIQSCMGAIFRINVVTKDLASFKAEYSEVPLYATLLNGENIFTTDIHSKGLVLVGNESKGLSDSAQAIATKAISIPRYKDGGAESLNAAIATSIICAIIRG